MVFFTLTNISTPLAFLFFIPLSFASANPIIITSPSNLNAREIYWESSSNNNPLCINQAPSNQCMFSFVWDPASNGVPLWVYDHNCSVISEIATPGTEVTKQQLSNVVGFQSTLEDPLYVTITNPWAPTFRFGMLSYDIHSVNQEIAHCGSNPQGQVICMLPFVC